MKRIYAYPAISLALATFIVTLSVVTPSSNANDNVEPYGQHNTLPVHGTYKIDKSIVVQSEWTSVGGAEYAPLSEKTLEGFLILDRSTQ